MSSLDGLFRKKSARELIRYDAKIIWRHMHSTFGQQQCVVATGDVLKNGQQGDVPRDGFGKKRLTSRELRQHPLFPADNLIVEFQFWYARCVDAENMIVNRRGLRQRTHYTLIMQAMQPIKRQVPEQARQEG